MDNLQYSVEMIVKKYDILPSFKPYYKWITFNTQKEQDVSKFFPEVLNLIING